MNRDEKRARLTALPPRIAKVEGRRAICPQDPCGGTWIAANDSGICLALINWHRIAREPAGKILSRGEIPKNLAGASCSEDIAKGLSALPLEEFRPFRLIAIVPGQQNLTEWRWDLERLVSRKHGWTRQHWFSSGFDEARAEHERRRVCQTDEQRHSPVRMASLRRLHRSHAPERGPFSICMHRADAATVSYTEVTMSPGRLIMRYQDGPPCAPTSSSSRSLPLKVGL